MKLFLHIKHWQLFLLLYIVPILVLILVFTAFNEEDFSYIALISSLVIFVVGALLLTLVWYWGIALNRRLADINIRILHSRNLTIAIIIPLLTLLFFVIAFNGSVLENNDLLANLYSLFFALNLVSILCILYMFRFVAKALESLEIRREASVNEYLIGIILLYFYPLGVWFLQPRINKIFGNREKN